MACIQRGSGAWLGYWQGSWWPFLLTVWLLTLDLNAALLLQLHLRRLHFLLCKLPSLLHVCQLLLCCFILLHSLHKLLFHMLPLLLFCGMLVLRSCELLCAIRQLTLQRLNQLDGVLVLVVGLCQLLCKGLCLGRDQFEGLVPAVQGFTFLSFQGLYLSTCDPSEDTCKVSCYSTS